MNHRLDDIWNWQMKQILAGIMTFISIEINPSPLYNKEMKMEFVSSSGQRSSSAMKIFVLLLFSAFLLNQASSQTTSFYFPSFSPESCNNGGLLCMGAVTAYDGYLSLSSEPLPGSPNQPVDEVGRVLYHQPVLAWPNITIVSSFTFRISKYPNSTDSGDGMAFIFAPTNDTSSAQSQGSYLGIMDEFTEGKYLCCFIHCIDNIMSLIHIVGVERRLKIWSGESH